MESCCRSICLVVLMGQRLKFRKGWEVISIEEKRREREREGGRKSIEATRGGQTEPYAAPI